MYSQTRCFQHASSIADIIAAFVNLGSEFPVMDSDIAVCSYQSIKIIYNAFRLDAHRFSLNTSRVNDVAKLGLSLLGNLGRNYSIISTIVRLA